MITIAGAGPVGLLLACLLGKRGEEVTLYEKRAGLPVASMAIGITPPSLDLLEKIDLKAAFLQRGVLIPRARVFESGKPCGTLDFRASENQILSLPQFGTLELLRLRLAEMKNVRLLEGVEMTPELLRTCRGSVIACDGADSFLRRHCGIPVTRRGYGVSFVMADFEDKEGLGAEARLYFSPRGAVESFPLPAGKRRWIAQRAGDAPPSLETLLHRVREAAGIDLAGRGHGTLCPFTPQRTLAKTALRQPRIQEALARTFAMRNLPQPRTP